MPKQNIDSTISDFQLFLEFTFTFEHPDLGFSEFRISSSLLASIQTSRLRISDIPILTFSRQRENSFSDFRFPILDIEDLAPWQRSGTQTSDFRFTTSKESTKEE